MMSVAGAVLASLKRYEIISGCQNINNEKASTSNLASFSGVKPLLGWYALAMWFVVITVLP